MRHGNLEFDIGFVRYLPEGLPLALIVGPAGGAFLIILIIILIIAIYRHIGERDRRIKRLEKQRDEMEMRVAQECKDGEYITTSLLIINHLHNKVKFFNSYMPQEEGVCLWGSTIHRDTISYNKSCSVIQRAIISLAHLPLKLEKCCDIFLINYKMNLAYWHSEIVYLR